MDNPESSIFRFSELTPRPWPNGRGVTRDVANKKSGNGSHDWLISIAELVEDAEFSHYEGCNRILTLVRENSIDLHISELSPLRCNPLVPVHFPGDRPTRCTMVGGPSRAFNVVINRERMMGAVSSVFMSSNHETKVPHSPVAIHCVAGTLMVQGEVLRSGDTLVAPRDHSLQTHETSATLLVVNVQERSGGVASCR
ncbi:MAG: HutD family protein [Alphaproteobacteria bacterium]|nr:HutD family protein [Alphaproteobacteria bacterium]